MKTLKLLIIMLMVLSLSGAAFAAGEMAMSGGQDVSWAGSKYYEPNWDMPVGDITKYPKGNEATTQYNPELIVPLDKQGMPWFQSTLNPQNLRRDDENKPSIFHVFGM